MEINDTGEMAVEIDGPIGWLILDNPQRRNAISIGMWSVIPELIAQLERDNRIRTIIVRGAGSEAFAAGADISEFGDLRKDPATMTRYNRKAEVAFNAVKLAKKPVIAMIHGACFGAGCALSLNCDLRIAAENALIAIPAAKLGVAYPFDCVKRLVDTVGAAAAREILYTARSYPADDAFRLGLVHRVVALDQLLPYARKYAMEMADKAPLAVRAAKIMIEEYLKAPDDRDAAKVAAVERSCVVSRDYREGALAFLEKRKPKFFGR